MNKKITIRDVAQAAGVSISTVHQALNDKPGVSEVTREHIRRIADDLGYRPNKMASGLKRRTQRVAVLLPDEVGRNRFYYPPLWQGVRDSGSHGSYDNAGVAACPGCRCGGGAGGV